MKDKEKLLQEVPLAEFFKEKIQIAISNQQIPASELIEFYLVNLLKEFRKTENLFEKEGAKLTEQPLALLLAKAIESDLHAKIRFLKQLGDISLYTAGFFAERVRRKSVGIDYYIKMGGGAYQNLAGIMNREKTFSELYSDLAQLFPKLVDVLSEVATAKHWQTNQDLLKLYEKWLATGDDHLEDLLNKEGIATNDRDLFNKTQ